jgi:hypothetical protein
MGREPGSPMRCGFCFITIDENNNYQHEDGCPAPNAYKLINAFSERIAALAQAAHPAPKEGECGQK